MPVGTPRFATQGPILLFVALAAAIGITLSLREPAPPTTPATSAPAGGPVRQADDTGGDDASASDPDAAQDAAETADPDATPDPDATVDPNATPGAEATPDPDATREIVSIAETFPLAPMLPDGELVYGPTLFGFDAGRIAAEKGGLLATYGEDVGGEVMDGPRIVERVARAYSISPRLLLTLLELESGWVTRADAERVEDPLGVGESGLYAGLTRTAEGLLALYHERRDEGRQRIDLAGNEAVNVAPGNPGSWALLAWLSRDVTAEAWPALEGPSRFWAIWQNLYAADPLFFGSVSVRVAPPPPALDLPFALGQRWYLLPGPAPLVGEAGPAAAIAFAPPPAGATGCFGSVEWVTAPLGGIVRWADGGSLVLDPNEDGDDWPGTGWSLAVRHLSPVDRASEGAFVGRGQPLGHPYCADGSGQTRVAFALRYDGAWVPALRPGAPLTLGGWTLEAGAGEGALRLTRPGLAARTSAATKIDGRNDVAALP